MPRHTRSLRATRQAVDLALAVPQVVAQRTLRFAQAGHSPSARDRGEFWLMGFEKVLVFHQSWLAMFAEAARINQQFVFSALQALWLPWTAPLRKRTTVATKMQRAAIDIAAAGIAPIHRRAVANARRLGRSRQ
jgi:hypothetical protein